MGFFARLPGAAVQAALLALRMGFFALLTGLTRLSQTAKRRVKLFPLTKTILPTALNDRKSDKRAHADDIERPNMI